MRGDPEAGIADAAAKMTIKLSPTGMVSADDCGARLAVEAADGIRTPITLHALRQNVGRDGLCHVSVSS